MLRRLTSSSSDFSTRGFQGPCAFLIAQVSRASSSAYVRMGAPGLALETGDGLVCVGARCAAVSREPASEDVSPMPMLSVGQYAGRLPGNLSGCCSCSSMCRCSIAGIPVHSTVIWSDV